MDTGQISIDLPRGVLSTLKQDPTGFVQEVRLAAVVKWYEMQRVSQARSAEIIGISRAEFLTALAGFGVSPFQHEADEIIQEVSSSG